MAQSSSSISEPAKLTQLPCDSRDPGLCPAPSFSDSLWLDARESQRGSCQKFSKVSILVHLPHKVTVESSFQNLHRWEESAVMGVRPAPHLLPPPSRSSSSSSSRENVQPAVAVPFFLVPGVVGGRGLER